MLTRTVVGVLSALLAFGSSEAAPQQSVSTTRSHAPPDMEMRERGTELIENQHKNDEAVDFYERTEHDVDRTGGSDPRTIEDKFVRLVPNGAGTTKLLLKDNGRKVTPEEYRRELETWRGVVQFMADPNDDRANSALTKYNKRQQVRTHLVDALLTAFTPKWIGSETRDGHDCDVFSLTPDPNFHPHSIFEEVLPHATAKIWVDREANQLMKAEALITSDFSFGGGVLGKLYKGGTFTMEQEEEAPGLWFPTRYQFDFSGRKFFFSFETHQSIETTGYQYIGTAKDALVVAEQELADPQPLAADP